MSTISRSEKARWIIAGSGAAAVLGALVSLFRLPPPPMTLASPGSSQAPVAKPIVQVAKSAETDAVLAEELVLRDVRPLFLPTERLNVTLPQPRREPGRTFIEGATPKLGLSDAEISISRDLPPVAAIGGQPAEKASPVDALTEDRGGVGLKGFGMTETPVLPMRPRGGFVEVVSTATGHVVHRDLLPAEARPPLEKSWEPMEMLAAVDAAGLAVPLVVTRSSRVEEVDVHFRQYLARKYRLGERLPPGYYRVVIGP